MSSTPSRQLFVVAADIEGTHDGLVFGCIEDDREIRPSEVELFINPSRGDDGFQFGLQEGAMQFPSTAWTVALTPDQRTLRAALLEGGSSCSGGDTPP